MLTSETGTAFFACPIIGYVVDRSRKRQLPFLAGILILAGAMAIFTTAQSTTVFVIGRVVQGIASAMVDVAGLALLRDRIGQDRLGEALGYFGTASMIGLIGSPFLGGLLYQERGFYAVCALGFAVITVDSILRLVVVEKSRSRRTGHAEEHVSTTTAVQTKPEHEAPIPRMGNDDSSHNRGNMNGSLILLKQHRVLFTLWALTVDGLIVGAFDAVCLNSTEEWEVGSLITQQIIPIFVEKTFGWGTLAAGLIFLAMATPALLEPFFGMFTRCDSEFRSLMHIKLIDFILGRLCDHFGVRIMTVLGYLLYAPSLVCLQFVKDNTLSHKLLLGVLMALCGFAGDLGQPALYLETQLVLDDLERQTPGIFGEQGAVAQAFGLQSMANYAGLAVGPIIGQRLFENFGWTVTMWTLGAIAGATTLPMFFLSHGTIAGDIE
jgi:MFS family permease